MCQCKTYLGHSLQTKSPPSHCSDFHAAARGVFREGQHRPHLVCSANGGTHSAVPSELTFPPYLIPQVYVVTFREAGSPVQLSYVLLLSFSWVFVGCKTTSFFQTSTSSLTLPLYSWQLCPGHVAAPVMLVTTWCLRGAQGSPQGRCPACSSPGHMYLLFVVLEDAGGSCKTPQHCSLRTFFTTSLLVWHCSVSWSCFLSPFSSVPTFLTIALHLPPSSWTAERTFSVGHRQLTKGPCSSGEIHWCF